MDRKPTASPEPPPACIYSRCGCCQKVEKLTAEIEQLHDQWYSPEHMDAVQKRTIDPLLSDRDRVAFNAGFEAGHFWNRPQGSVMLYRADEEHRDKKWAEFVSGRKQYEFIGISNPQFAELAQDCAAAAAEIEQYRQRLSWLDVSPGLARPNPDCNDCGGYPVQDGPYSCYQEQCEFCWRCEDSVFMRAQSETTKNTAHDPICMVCNKTVLVAQVAATKGGKPICIKCFYVEPEPDKGQEQNDIEGNDRE